MTSQVPAPEVQRQGSVPWGKIVLFGCGTLVLLAAGVAVAVYYGFKFALNSSPAYRTAVAALTESSAAAERLGKIEKIGVPGGSVASQSTGTGAATLSMLVTGSKTTGTYYATLYRKNGEWYFESGRLELADGRSINIPGRGAVHATNV